MRGGEEEVKLVEGGIRDMVDERRGIEVTERAEDGNE